MSDDISSKILSQASNNIQKLFDLSTRIDERVKAIQERQEDFDERLQQSLNLYGDLMRKVAVMESVIGNDGLSEKIESCQKDLNGIDRRVIAIESTTGDAKIRWNRFLTFIIQLVWVILAAYLLTKLNLQPPAVP